MATLGFSSGMTAAPTQRRPAVAGKMGKAIYDQQQADAQANRVRQAEQVRAQGGLATSAPGQGRPMQPQGGFATPTPTAPRQPTRGLPGPMWNSAGAGQGQPISSPVGAVNDVGQQFPNWSGGGFSGASMPQVNQAYVDDMGGMAAGMVGGMGTPQGMVNVANGMPAFEAPGYRLPEQDEALQQQNIRAQADLARRRRMMAERPGGSRYYTTG